MKDRFLNRIIEKYRKLPVTAKASLIYLLVNVLQNGLAFLSSPIFTRILTSEEYGTVSVFYSVQQVLCTFACFCLSAGCFDVGMQDNKDDRDNYSYSMLILSNIITVITGVIVVALYPYLKPYLQVEFGLIVVMFIGFLFQPAFDFWSRHERYEYRYKKPAIIISISSIISVLVAILSVVFFTYDNVYERIVGAFLPMLLCYMIIYTRYIANKNLKVNFSYIKFALLFNLPLIPHYLSLYVLNASDRLMISYFDGKSAAAYYSLSYSIATIISIIWSSINSAIVPTILDCYEKKEYKKVSNMVMPILSAYAIICLFVILLAPEAIRIFATEEYTQAIYVIPAVIGGLFFQAMYYLFTNILYYYKKPQYVMYASIGSAILNFGLNWIFIPIYGYIAAGYTTLVCYLIQAIVDYIVSRKVVGEEIYNIKAMIKLSVEVIVIALLSNLLYNGYVIRYIIAFSIVFITITFRKKIIQILKFK